MHYLGGKSRIAAHISGIISTNAANDKAFVSLFCGSCAVEARVTGFERKILNDKHEYLIALWRGVRDGYELPDTVSEEQYRYVRDHKDMDKVLTGFVGFGCSFGGKWFGGYARDKRGDNSALATKRYASAAKQSLLRDIELLRDAEFICRDYKDVDVPQGAVVYADPPYRGTTGYGMGRFDTDAFWEHMRKLSQLGHKVFISEQEAPLDFECVWSREVTRKIDCNKNNQPKRIERLFIYRGD